MFDEMELLHTSSLKVSTEKYYEHFCGGREREREATKTGDKFDRFYDGC